METEDGVLASCPIKPLGVSAGRQFCWYLLADANPVRIALERHSKLTLIAMFGRDQDWLEINFPIWSAPRLNIDQATGKWVPTDPPRVTGFDQAKAAEWLVKQCAALGAISPTEAYSRVGTI